MSLHTAGKLPGFSAPSEAILKRDNSYNVTHPTYKAFAEVGKAEKTIFLCDYLASQEVGYWGAMVGATLDLQQISFLVEGAHVRRAMAYVEVKHTGGLGGREADF